jgi:hypothetical protein
MFCRVILARHSGSSKIRTNRDCAWEAADMTNNCSRQIVAMWVGSSAPPEPAVFRQSGTEQS